MNGMISRFRRTAAVVCALSMCVVSTASFAERPTVPGKPSGSVGDQRVSLQWASSEDDNEVRGYNLYLNGDYMVTVFENSYEGFLDTSRENTFYVTAFDTPLPGEERAYSSRSEETVVGRFDPDDSSPGEPPPASVADTTAPSLPSGLTLVSAVSNAIAITWAPSSDNVGVTGYNVYRQGDYAKTVFTTRYVDNNPLSGVANNYSVVAFDAAKNYTSKSAEISISTPGSPSPPSEPGPEPVTDDVTAPSTPDGLSVVLATRNAVKISWNPATDDVAVAGYNVYLNDAYAATVFGTSFVDLAPIPGSVHAYSVVAFDAARNYSSRSEAVVITGAEDAPDAAQPSAGLSAGPLAGPLAGPSAGPFPNVLEPDTTPSDDIDEYASLSEPLQRVPSPDPNDPFGSRLEVDSEAAQPNGAPTTPKNLRADLVSNDWAAINWAPANDDVGVAAYNIYRSDGVTYTVSADSMDANINVDDRAQAEVDGYWSTTSFIDCNGTHFNERIHNCGTNQPVPGETYVYRVSASDAQGGESPLSLPLSITYHVSENAVVPMFDDFYKAPDDQFAQSRDLSHTRFFLDEFDLVFNDEFEGTSIDASKWQTEFVWQDSIVGNDNSLPPVCTHVDPNPDSAEVDRCGNLSAVLSSHEHFGFVYGYVEARMKMAGATGSFSGFSLHHSNKGSGVWLHAPELDIVTYLGENLDGVDHAIQSYRFDDVISGLTRTSPAMPHQNPGGQSYSAAFHTFGVLWEPQLIVWYIDGQEVKRITGPMVPRQSMNLVNYLAAGRAGEPYESSIDYVRVYQRGVYKGTSSFGS